MRTTSPMERVIHQTVSTIFALACRSTCVVAIKSTKYLSIHNTRHLSENWIKSSKAGNQAYQPDGSIFSLSRRRLSREDKTARLTLSVALLNTLFYFNTSYYGLKIVEQHWRLSFGTVFRHWKKSSNNEKTKNAFHTKYLLYVARVR